MVEVAHWTKQEYISFTFHFSQRWLIWHLFCWIWPTLLNLNTLLNWVLSTVYLDEYFFSIKMWPLPLPGTLPVNQLRALLPTCVQNIRTICAWLTTLTLLHGHSLDWQNWISTFYSDQFIGHPVPTHKTPPTQLHQHPHTDKKHNGCIFNGPLLRYYQDIICFSQPSRIVFCPMVNSLTP